MNRLPRLLAFALGAAALAASAQTVAPGQPPEPTKQQNRMIECNKQAGDRKGEERKAFMKECLTDKQKAQQEKMKTCNAEASRQGLDSDARKQFMSECLRKQ
ncbi:MAG TPA: PsiF family protein [Burkholderiaceae bacterium]|nr:PsiF family protein [Burkholderiaceae bacterium]